MIKVLHVYRTFFPDTQGGLEEVIRQICINVTQVKVRVFTISHQITQPDELLVDGIKIYRIPLSFEIASCDFSFTGHTKYKALVEWADIINYHFPWPFADILYLLYGRYKKTVITYHSDIIRQKYLLKLYSPLMHYFLSRADHLIASTPQYLESSTVLNKYYKKASVIPFGLDEENYPKAVQEDIDKWTNRFQKPFFLFVGVLRYYKGLHIVLEAAKGANYDVVIAGKGPEETNLKKQASTLELDNVHFLGYIDDQDKMALLKLCRGIVFPSYQRSEAFGITLLEGIMSTKPVISVDIGSGMNYINLHKKTGIQVPPEDIDAFRQAMDKLYSQPEYANQLGEAGRKRFESHFTGKIMGQKYDALYQELMQ